MIAHFKDMWYQPSECWFIWNFLVKHYQSIFDTFNIFFLSQLAIIPSIEATSSNLVWPHVDASHCFRSDDDISLSNFSAVKQIIIRRTANRNKLCPLSQSSVEIVSMMNFFWREEQLNDDNIILSNGYVSVIELLIQTYDDNIPSSYGIVPVIILI